jgi:hypothetical protein
VLVMEFVQVGAVFTLGFQVGVVKFERSSLGAQVEVCRSGCCGFLGFHGIKEIIKIRSRHHEHTSQPGS